MFCHFTNSYYKIFMKNKYNITNNNPLLLNIIKERNNIISLMKDINITITKTKIHNINKLLIGTFVYKSGIIKSLPTLHEEYCIQWGDNNIYIKGNSNINGFLSRIQIFINILEYLRNKSNCKNKIINIYIILTDLKKSIPNKNKIISAKHINTGYTDHRNNIIFIWRYEEFEKVLFHELVHYFELDHSSMIRKVDNNISIKGPINYFEAFTDFWGCLYHLIYISLVTKIKIKLLLEIELAYMENIAKNIYSYYDLNNKKNIEHKSDAFSYYILKWYLFKYALDNDINKVDNFYDILNIIILNNMDISKIYNINNIRMTLLQLK